MEEKDKLYAVPYVVYESAQSKSERIIKRLILALIIVTAMLFTSNVLWLKAWMQYDYTDETQEVTVDTEGEGNANYIGNDGEINN